MLRFHGSSAALAASLVVASGACDARSTARSARPDSLHADTARADSTHRPVAAPARDTVVPADSLRAPRAPLVARPAAVRGLYVNRWAALGDRMWQLIDVARRTEVNALVIDVKDDRGFVLYRSRVPLAREIGADTTMPMRPDRVRAILDTMRAHGIYPVARIVVAKDPLLASRKLEWSIKRRDDPASPWLDKNGNPWLDPHQEGVWRYAADLAAEAVDLGFSEVQFDYVRFPDEKRLVREAVFPLAAGRLRAQVIRDQLGMVRQRVTAAGVPMTIDVFGLTTSDTTDMGIGQRWEMFVDRADIVLPMTYPSHYAPGSYGIRNPNARPYEVLSHALQDAKRRSAGVAGAARIVPWYQDFTLGPPRYGAEQLRAQIRAGYDAGIHEWMLWNPGSRYTVAALRPEGAPGDTSGAQKAPDA
ncbi:MAG TPA: putative glycoside hydrolase [Gemmatimonadaceae bacterium]|nr:putative glycoside hydrolase [Gemmatimonadaceae bacterium]